MSMFFESTTNLGDSISLTNLCESRAYGMYLDDLGKIPNSEIVDNYFDTIEQSSTIHIPLSDTVGLDTHVPPGTGAEFGVLRTTINGFLHSSTLGTSTDKHIVLGENSSIIHPSFLNENFSSSVFPSFYNSLLNPIFDITSFSNSNAFLLLLCGGHVVWPAGSSSGGAAVASRNTTTTSTGKADHAFRTTGTALGHKAEEGGDGNDPRKPNKSQELPNQHYYEMTEEQFTNLLHRILRNQLTKMSDGELMAFVNAFSVYSKASFFFDLRTGTTTRVLKNHGLCDYVFLRHRLDIKTERFFVRRKASANPDYVLNHDERIQNLILSDINNEARRDASLVSSQSARTSFSSSRGSERAPNNYNFYLQGSHATASSAPVVAAEAQAEQAQRQRQEESQLQGQSQKQSITSQNNLSPFEIWFPRLMSLAGAIIGGREIFFNIPHNSRQKAQRESLRNHGLNRGRQDFADDILQANKNRPFGGFLSPPLPLPALRDEISSLSLNEENSEAFKNGQAEGYSTEQVAHQRLHPQHKDKINEIGRGVRRQHPGEVQIGEGFSINQPLVISLLLELGAFLFHRRNQDKQNKNKDTKKEHE